MKYIRFLVLSVVFLLFFTAILVSILLISAGLLAVPVSLALISGIGKNVASVASDLSAPAMFLTGISCISAGLAIMLAVVVYFPKQAFIFRKLP
jgi:hypothetical protein